MSILTEDPMLERLLFFTGQRLYASDVQAIEEHNRRMRWLHNQSLHQPGIGRGFAVTGEIGDREVTVGAGYAVDSIGREIVLTQQQVIPVPPVADDGYGNPVIYDLTVRYPGDELLEEVETRAGICLPRDAVRLREQPIFCWVELDRQSLQPKDTELKDDVRNGLRTIIMRAEIQNYRLYGRISIAQRRDVRPEKGAYISAGKTKTESTNWEEIERKEVQTGVTELLLLKTSVDTSIAHFEVAPHYSARIEGERIVRSGEDFDYLIEGVTYLLVPLIENTQKQITNGFEVYLLLPRIGSFVNPPIKFLNKDIDTINDILKNLDWHIVWMGIEG